MALTIALGILFLLLFGFVGIVAKLNKATDTIWLPPIYQSQIIQGLVSLLAIFSLLFLVFLLFWNWKLALTVLGFGVLTLRWLLVPICERVVLVPLVSLFSLIFRPKR
jgi:hypothetical protein